MSQQSAAINLAYCKYSSMNAANSRIGEWLGMRSPATEGEILRIVEGRLSFCHQTPEHARAGTVRD